MIVGMCEYRILANSENENIKEFPLTFKYHVIMFVLAHVYRLITVGLACLRNMNIINLVTKRM